MKYYHILISLSLVPALMITPSTVRADIVWSWSFDQAAYVVGPSDSIIVRATLFNEPSSTEDLKQIQGVGAIFSGDLQKTYNFTFGPTGNSSEFSLQFFGVDLAPGQSYPFIYGSLTPIGGAASPGIYPADPATIGLDLPGTASVQTNSLNTFSVQVVPEPSTMFLFGTGVACLTAGRLRRKKESI
jgi:hypothetical protein